MKNIIFSLFAALLISACGGGSSTPPAVSASLSASPTSVLLTNPSTLSWSSVNASACSAAWTSQTSVSGSEAVTISTAGNNTYSITCSGAGAPDSASVTVEGYRITDGAVVDGYISNAEVCIDENDSWTCNSSEHSSSSNNDGKFTIKYANGNLLSIGGTDLDSQILLDNFLLLHKQTGHSDFKVITPVTSVAAFISNTSNINALLGINASIDVFTFDPVDNKGDGGINDYFYEKGNQLTVLALTLQNIANDLNASSETTQDFWKAIAEALEDEFAATEKKVDIETEAFITKVLEKIIIAKTLTISDEARLNSVKALSGVMPVIEVKSSNDLTTSVIRFAISTLQTDIKAISNGTALTETIDNYTKGILSYIATDQSIAANNIAPAITAIADSALTSEDTQVIISNVLANDSYLSSSPISITAVTGGANGITSLENNIITYTPVTDFNGTDNFTYTIVQGDKTSTANITVTIEAVNDAPTINSASIIQAAENQTGVATISVSDVDGDTLTLTFGGTDADSFNLSTDNVLTFKEAPDYETKSSYILSFSLTDGALTITKDVTVRVTNLNDIAPSITSSATFTAAENQTSIGTVTASDADGDAVIFSVSGTELAITQAGVLSFLTAPDFETKSSFTATVSASDGTTTTNQAIAVTVTNVNEVGPVFTSATTFTVTENQTSIGTVTATDADGNPITFSIEDKDVYENAVLISEDGALTFAPPPDFDGLDAEGNAKNNTWTYTVTANDGLNTTTQNITVNITDVFDPLWSANDVVTISARLTDPIICPNGGGSVYGPFTGLRDGVNGCGLILVAVHGAGEVSELNVSGGAGQSYNPTADNTLLNYANLGTNLDGDPNALGYVVWNPADFLQERIFNISIPQNLSDLTQTTIRFHVISSSELYDGYMPDSYTANMAFDENQKGPVMFSYTED